MKSYMLLLTSGLLLLPLLSCADNNSNARINNKMFPSGDILTISESNNGKIIASYFSTLPAKKEAIAKRIIHILKSTKASASIIDFAESRLHRNRRLKKAQFRLPLTDDNGAVYEFTYSSNIQSDLFVLNYKYLGLSKI